LSLSVGDAKVAIHHHLNHHIVIHPEHPQSSSNPSLNPPPFAHAEQEVIPSWFWASLSLNTPRYYTTPAPHISRNSTGEPHNLHPSRLPYFIRRTA
jgi:hypothetical protein